jgi:hypothetical protein
VGNPRDSLAIRHVGRLAHRDMPDIHENMREVGRHGHEGFPFM